MIGRTSGWRFVLGIAALAGVLLVGVLVGTRAHADSFDYSQDPDVAPLLAYFETETENSNPTVVTEPFEPESEAPGYKNHFLTYSANARILVEEAPETPSSDADAHAIGYLSDGVDESFYAYNPSTGEIELIPTLPLGDPCWQDRYHCEKFVAPMLWSLNLVVVLRGTISCVAQETGYRACRAWNRAIDIINWLRPGTIHGSNKIDCNLPACDILDAMSNCSLWHIGCVKWAHFSAKCISCFWEP